MTNILAAIIVTVVTNVVWTDNSVPAPLNYIPCVDVGETENADDMPEVDVDAGILPRSAPAIIGGKGTTTAPSWGWNQGTPATEKTKTVTVTEVTTLKFKWRGKEFKAHDKKVLSTTVTKYRKKEEWEPITLYRTPSPKINWTFVDNGEAAK